MRSIIFETKNAALSTKSAALAEQLKTNEATIVTELNAAQGKAIDLGRQYHADAEKYDRAMHPSVTLNEMLMTIG